MIISLWLTLVAVFYNGAKDRYEYCQANPQVCEQESAQARAEFLERKTGEAQHFWDHR